MRIFDETKTKELFEYDQTEGYLRPDKLVTHHEEVPEKIIKTAKETADELKAEGKEIEEEDGAYFLVLKTYPSGGKDVQRIEDDAEPKQDAWDEEEEIAVFVPYTEKQKAEIEISQLKQKLFDSDYKAIKYAEGQLSEEEYSPIKEERQAWRDRINELEEVTEEV